MTDRRVLIMRTVPMPHEHDPGDEDRSVDSYCRNCGDPFDEDAQNAALRLLAECAHADTIRGANAPRRYGSWRTEVCRGCGAFRTHGHDPGRSQMSAWQPSSEYADATAGMELD